MTTTPDHHGGDDDLVEGEGVNAGWSPPAGREPGDVRSGGAPNRAEDQVQQAPEATELVGPAGKESRGPGQELSAGEG